MLSAWAVVRPTDSLASAFSTTGDDLAAIRSETMSPRLRSRLSRILRAGGTSPSVGIELGRFRLDVDIDDAEEVDVVAVAGRGVAAPMPLLAPVTSATALFSG
ncbi:hypothetical protein [Actinomadura opuntiae]|uniref:hypothetical protein n=1 Tax=Actinomadura sp. OS1-43 TaxID=604315 RepID=UPI00255B3CA7|nr:hypothetical protein [Actinomadura sp. OS1-43]MDL4814113.1 hypothetical protein [Actinomadura sp. OS1-43]